MIKYIRVQRVSLIVRWVDRDSAVRALPTKAIQRSCRPRSPILETYEARHIVHDPSCQHRAVPEMQELSCSDRFCPTPGWRSVRHRIRQQPTVFDKPSGRHERSIPSGRISTPPRAQKSAYVCRAFRNIPALHFPRWMAVRNRAVSLCSSALSCFTRFTDIVHRVQRGTYLRCRAESEQ
jgi:hypothetical protein